MESSMLRRAALLWAGLAAFAAASPAAAQAPQYPPPTPPPAFSAPPPPASPEASEIAACLCLWHVVTALGNEMGAKRQSYDAARDEVARLDAQLQSARTQVDVNDPQSVGRFKQLLEQRDAVFRQSTGISGDLNGAIEHYDARTNEYNARCANHPRDPELLRRIEATLICPPAN